MLNLQQLELAIDTYNLLIAERKEDYQELLHRKTIPTRLDTEQIIKQRY